MSSGDDWFKWLVRAVGPTLRDALAAGDMEVLEGLEAVETTIWTGVRACESVMNFLVRETLKEMDPADPEGAHKVRHEIMSVRQSWRGLKWQGVQEALLTMRRLELISVYKDVEEIQEDGVDKAGYREISLAPIWDPVMFEIKQSGVQRTIFGSACGKLIGLTARDMGVAALRMPILIASKARENGGRISEAEVEEIVSSLSGGRRRFSDFEGRDALKPEDIRFFREYDGDEAIVNEKVFRALERLNVVAREIYRQMMREEE